MAKKRFWHPAKSYRYDNRCFAIYRPTPEIAAELNTNVIYSDYFNSGAEREEWIREQSELIRRCANDKEYVDILIMCKKLTA